MKRLGRLLILCSFVAVLPTRGFAGVDEGIAAYKRGDFVSAAAEFKQLANQGDKVAQYDLAYLYTRGEGVVKDEKEALRWYRRAADQGYAPAQVQVGHAFADGYGGVTQDDVEAVRWYRLAANQENPLAQYLLGRALKFGEGVTRDIDESLNWFSLAAEQGHTTAMINIGQSYCGVFTRAPRDCDTAARWYRRAADKGDDNAMVILGNLYSQGGRGVVLDYPVAVHWYREAAARGNGLSQGHLSGMYERGAGVPQNLVLAYALLPDSGNDSSNKKVAELAARLTPKELTKAQELARKMKVPGQLLKVLDEYLK